MKTLYIQCNMGVAGDMLMSALLEILPQEQQHEFLRKINSLGIPGVSVSVERAVKCGITGTHVHVRVGGMEEGADDVSAEAACMAGAHDHQHVHPHHHHHDHHHDHDYHHHHDDHHHHHDDHHDHDYHHHHDDDHHHTHEHNGLGDIRAIIEGLDVSDRVKKDALAIYDLIAKAESQVHGHEMEHIHFHEVGSLDAVTDVVGNCLLMEMIGADYIAVSPIHVGSGTVKCAHGILPVPAPATALILAGLPVYSADIRGELCTPTGAALVKHFGQEFGPMPAMTMEKTGYGMGNKDFPQAANCVRVILGESVSTAASRAASESGDRESDTSVRDSAAAPWGQDCANEEQDKVYELCCNLDDMTAEEIGFAMEQLLEAGALDVWTEAITMKKSRPGVKLCVLTRLDDRAKLVEIVFKHTTTIGVRWQQWERCLLRRDFSKRETAWGSVQVKTVEGWGVHREKAEYEDLARIAREHGLSLDEVRTALNARP